MATKESKEPKGFQRRDLLLELQRRAQEKWDNEKVFEEDAPEEAEEGKYFGNFPFPYMNGLLHLGHAFTLSKVDFAVAYYRLRGRRALWPFGFHCTGMPIKACADKLKREIELYGNPPTFQEEVEEVDSLMKNSDDVENGQVDGDFDPTVFKAKKGKAAKKAVGGKKLTQWEIMEMSGIDKDTIPNFQDPQHWLRYFPPIAIEHLKQMGCCIDWRRSFITTDANPYFDSFVRWHLTTLRKRGRVVKDTRYSVYSPIDGQPCMDHDRQSGEGVNPQEYTIIKMRIKSEVEAYDEDDKNPFVENGVLGKLCGRNVFLAAATLRPETMYGQTNCWVLPSATYGCFEMNGGEVWIMLERAARNAAYQGLSGEMGEMRKLCEVNGADLIGLPLKAPLTSLDTIYALPLMTILTNKGTGIVTSVPSDAPDDYMGLQDLKRKPDMRAKFGIKDKCVMPFEVIPIINIPEFGDMSAVKVCTDLKIASQNDKRQLEEAKRLTYLKGFTDGIMLVGDYAGKKVQEAKPLMKRKLIERGEASVYCEPEKEVISRSGDECVVALTDQWYITYGDEDWMTSTKHALEQMNCYSDECKRGFEATLSWLRQWACSRSYGLGTHLPWDPEYLIESLSDSTIYMAYYAVAHFLQNGDIYGQSSGPISASAMTDTVWDFIFLNGPAPEDSSISHDMLHKMRREFSFWYPFDLRASGKDLIQNHLTFTIYNHTSIWENDNTKWPLSFRCNGHLMVNGEKMSKSLGNFKTLKEAIDEYSSDAMRLAFADAGDGLDDANFAEETCNAAILRLTKELDWFEKMFEMNEGLRQGEFNYADKAFENDMSGCIARAETHYENLMFREALREAWFELTRARDTYRLLCNGDQGMHIKVFKTFADSLCRVLAPITPHWSEHVWGAILGNGGTVLKAGWPCLSSHDVTMQKGYNHMLDVCTLIRQAKIKQETPKKKQQVAPQRVMGVKLYVASEFSGWHALVLDTIEGIYKDGEDLPQNEIPAIILEAARNSAFGKSPDFKKQTKNILSFARKVADNVSKIGRDALAKTLPFNEFEILLTNVEYMKKSIGLQSLEILPAPADGEGAAAVPETPDYQFVFE